LKERTSNPNNSRRPRRKKAKGDAQKEKSQLCLPRSDVSGWGRNSGRKKLSDQTRGEGENEGVLWASPRKLVSSLLAEGLCRIMFCAKKEALADEKKRIMLSLP